MYRVLPSPITFMPFPPNSAQQGFGPLLASVVHPLQSTNCIKVPDYCTHGKQRSRTTQTLLRSTASRKPKIA